MNPEEPPRGGRMLEKPEDDANALERRPTPSENITTDADHAPDSTAHRTPRKRKKPFVL